MNILDTLEQYFSYSAAELRTLNLGATLKSFLADLENGSLRAAQKMDDVWQVDVRVKQAILLCFRFSGICSFNKYGLPFSDKDIFDVQTPSLEKNIRIIMGGSSIRRGAYIGERVTMMPPSYINVGAYVDSDSLVDSHALVGSCAQIGKRVHISAAAQIGGVLEPVGSKPVIVEDDAFIGGNTGIYEGVTIKAKAVIAAGVILTGSTKVYDLVQQRVLQGTGESPLEIPECAVVVPGARQIAGAFAEEHKLSVNTALIVKYRDDKTDSKAALEYALRS